MKLTDIKPGDVIQTDAGFTCMGAERKMVKFDEEIAKKNDWPGAGLYVDCESGQHFLDGQEDEPDADLVGLSFAATAAE